MNSIKKTVLVAVTALMATGAWARDIAREPKAMKALIGMARYMGSLNSFEMEIQDSIDKTDSDGRLLTFNHERSLEVRRPDRLHMEIDGDLEKEQVYYDGKNVTVMLAKDNVYAQAPAADTIDDTLDLLRDKFSIRRPLMVLMYKNFGDRVGERITSAKYIGTSTIDGKECDHIALTAVEGVNWQLWIEKDDTPVPVKIVIHYSQFPGEPRYIMNLVEFTANPEFTDETFAFTAPADAEKIQFEVSPKMGEDK